MSRKVRLLLTAVGILSLWACVYFAHNAGEYIARKFYGVYGNGSSAKNVFVALPSSGSLVVPEGRARPSDFRLEVFGSLREAHTLLDTARAGYTTMPHASWGWVRKKGGAKWHRTVYTLGAVNTLLAVVPCEGGAVRLVKVTPMGSIPEGFDVQSGPSNGVATEFVVSSPPGWIALRIKRAVTLPTGKFREVQYSPYSVDLDIPEVREAGARYIQCVVDSALRALRKYEVESVAFPGRQVADYIPREVAITLSVIEHIDPARFLEYQKSGLPIGTLINRELVTLGLNTLETHRYSVSGSGARGHFQFMERTYQNVRTLYPRARLDGDFVEGTNSHFNAALATLCLLDSDLAQLPSDAREQIADNPALLGQYLAAAYNGGSGNARKAVVNKTLHVAKLKHEETRVYVEKFKSVWSALYPAGAKLSAYREAL